MQEEPRKKPGTVRLTAGRLLAAIALVFCVPVGAMFVSVAVGAIGIVFGIVGYALGARTLGFLAIVLCVAAMFVGLLVGQGVIPGDFYDRAVDGFFRDLNVERFTNE